jgi:peptidoglycan/LPS O-acetylase OafA/YrhL
MWGRYTEIVLGVWLMVSPWTFGHAPGAWFLWGCGLLGGAAIVGLSAACWKEGLEKLHLCHLGVGAFLVGTAFLAGTSPPPPAYQNHVVVGLLLMMMAIVPTRSARPPARWIEFYERRRAARAAPATSQEESAHGTTG